MDDEKFFTVNKNNIDTWNMLVYGWIIQGMLHNNPELKYGDAMNRSEEVTNILFNALEKELK